MKPVAPTLHAEPKADLPSLQSEIRALCERGERGERGDESRAESRASDERITLPAPPSPEALRAATPVPPRDPPSHDTIPAPPPSAARRRADGEPEVEPSPSTIPGPPRVPSIAI